MGSSHFRYAKVKLCHYVKHHWRLVAELQSSNYSRMINSQENNMSTQPFSTSSMDLFASPQSLDIEQRKRKKKKNHKLLSSFEIYLDVAGDPVNDCLSKSKQSIEEEEQKKCTLQEFDESEVHADSDQEQRQNRKKKKHRSKDMDNCDMLASKDLNKQEVGLPEKNMKGFSEAEDSVDALLFKSKETKKRKKYKLQEMDESEICADSEQEQRHAVQKKKKKHRSKDKDIYNMLVSGDLNKQEVGLPEKNMKVLSEAEHSVDALLFKSKETKKRKKKYKLQEMDESEICADSEQEQGRAVKKKKRKHRSIDMDVCGVKVSGDLNDDQVGGAEVYPSRNEIFANAKKGHHTGAESKCASDDALNGDANTITLSECSNRGKGKKKRRQLESEVNILSDNKSHSKYQASCKNHTPQCDEQCLTENNEEMHRSEQVDPLPVCESLEMTHNEQAAKCEKKKKSKTRKLTKHIEEIKFLNERQGFDNHLCYLCEMSVADKDIYIKHLAAAHNKHVFQCSQCGRCCTSREGLSLHQSSACDQEKLFLARIFKCKDCPMSYKNYRSLWRHNAEQHKIGHTVREHVCQRCDKSFTRQASVQIHLLTCMKRKENSGEEGQGEVPCKVCQKVFSSRRSLRYHISTIHEQRQFECSTCGEIFRWSKSLSKHRQKCHE